MTNTSKFSTEQVFGSREELMTWVQNVACSQGFVIVTKRSRSSLLGNVFKIVLACDRGGVSRSKDAKTKKDNCPFELVGKFLKARDGWTLRVVCDYHNHDPAMCMEGHPYARCYHTNSIFIFLHMQDVFPYLRSVWLDKYADRFVSLWTDKHINFGNSTTNRVESQHLNGEPPRHDSFFTDLNEEQPRHNSLLKQIPEIFHPYITNIQDVRGDGNCGFRAIAVCLGYGEDQWLSIRHELLDELVTSYSIYSNVLYGIDEILTSLSFWESPAPEQHWMLMPETGILIANRFGVILHYLAIGGSMTCFPLWKGPEEFQYHRVFTISHVNSNHYVMVQLEGEYPMPPISGLWTRKKAPSAAGWETIYKSRLELYKKLKPTEKSFLNIED